MASRPLDEESIFHIARQLSSSGARAAYLDQVCGGEGALRERVEALLGAHEREGSLLSSSLSGPPATAAAPVTERPGAMIGRYRLLEQIGEGGMGVVFVAEQERPIRRRVALKVIKPGMDSKTVVARFEAERQALAMMDHPNIAKVLDAGTTDSGRPYFAMELVRGVAITDYCDQNRLTIRERLSLFIDVCQAIQHAHQKGIIHRDIKPSNVLVTLHDGTPVPKVIDFGVAKALNARLTDRTIYTEHLQVIGTLLYMSPEQAELSGLDVDTRSDVYSLGVVLYELLTGTTPFQQRDLDEAGLDEQRRIIRDREPPRASIRISSLGETATVIAESRKTDAKRLHQMVRGDLDWIVTKAMEKDRTQRYKTADALALDITRLLADEPIEARPPSHMYRLRRLLRRNRVAVTAIGFVTLLILASTAVAFSGWLSAWRNESNLKRANDDLEQARQISEYNAHQARHGLEQKERSLRKLAKVSYSEAVLAAMAGDEQKADTALQVAAEAGISHIKINVIRALLAINAGCNDDAIRYAEASRDDPLLSDASDQIAVHASLVTACCYAGYDDRSFVHLATLRTLHPQCDIDYLFMAYAELVSDPQKVLMFVQNNYSIRCSSVGLFLRGIARMMLGDQAQDAAMLETANRDLEYAQLLFRDNQCALAYRVLGLASAINVARAQGRLEDAARIEATGRDVAAQLEKCPGFAGSHYDLWLFYSAIGEEERASQAIRRVGKHPGTYSFLLAADCFRRFPPPRAWHEFDGVIAPEVRDSMYVRLAEAHLVRDLEGGADRVHELVGDLLENPSPLIRRYALLAECLVRSDKEIETLARRGMAHDSPEVHATVESWGDRPCIEYLAGLIDDDELWQRTGERGFSGAVAHFTMGMKDLAEGGRDAALAHFRACAATNRTGIFDVAWAKAYVQRMEEDRNWPTWLRTGD